MAARSRHCSGWLSLATLATLLISTGALGFQTYPFQSGAETLYLKWGDNHAGSAGGTVTWSLLPNGTPGNTQYCGSSCPGNSVGTLNIENAPGAGFSPRTLAELEPRIVIALERWSAATGIEFVRIANDSGIALNDPSAQPPATGHIRIGIYAFSSGGGAVGYAPPPNGGTAAGDVLFDAHSFYQFAPGVEGASFDTGFAPNDFDTLLLHELGHAMGLAHPAFDGSCPVMQVRPSCLGRINRILDEDDLAGAGFLYLPIFRDGFE